MKGTPHRPGLETAWRHIYNRTYRIDRTPEDPCFDTSGWVDTYTGVPYPSAAMEEWVGETCRRIQSHRPRTILEIGCGTGLLGHRLIPALDAYCGLDFAVGALQRFSLGLDTAGTSTVCLVLGAASDLDRVPKWQYDCVVLNSVVQYFPDTTYVSDVLRTAKKLLGHGGFLFIGDVRHRGLLGLHHAWREWWRAPANTSAADARENAARGRRADREWCATPAELADLVGSVTGAVTVETRPREGCHDTEMNLFRYDALCYYAEKHAVIRPAAWVPWSPGLERRLIWNGQDPVGVRGVPNSRLSSVRAVAEELERAPAEELMENLRVAQRDMPATGSLDAFRRIAAEGNGVLRADWTRDPSGHTVDIALVPGGAASQDGPLLVQWH